MVEQAIILPMMVFLILGIIQLAMIQHARIASEYAVYSAARSGIVYNGDKDKMQLAAMIALLPTYGKRVDTWSSLFTQFISNVAGPAMINALAGAIGLPFVQGLLPVQVEIVPHPEAAIGDRKGIMQQQGHLNRQEIDFDDWRDNPAQANQLTVELKYFYEMRIPFANWMIQTMWLAENVDVGKFGGGYAGGVNFANPENVFGGSANTTILAQGAAQGDSDVRLALGWRALGQYRIPIKTWYTMRMQSNLYLDNLP